MVDDEEVSGYWTQTAINIGVVNVRAVESMFIGDLICLVYKFRYIIVHNYHKSCVIIIICNGILYLSRNISWSKNK